MRVFIVGMNAFCLALEIEPEAKKSFYYSRTATHTSTPFVRPSCFPCTLALAFNFPLRKKSPAHPRRERRDFPFAEGNKLCFDVLTPLLLRRALKKELGVTTEGVRTTPEEEINFRP